MLGKHSGRHALHERVKDLGFPELDRDELKRVYQAFTNLADGRKGLTNSDIEELVASLGFSKKVAAEQAVLMQGD